MENRLNTTSEAPPRRPGGMLARVLSALVLIPLVLALLFWASSGWLFAAVGLIGTLGLYEYFRLIRSMGLEPQPWFGYAGFWFLLAGLYSGRIAAPVLLSGLLLAAFPAALARRIPLRDRVLGTMADLFGIFYLVFCLYPALPIRFGFGNRIGLEWLVILLSVVWAGDIAALFVGKRLGRTRLAPVVSPKKTNEGSAAGLAAGLAVALALHWVFFPDLPAIHVVAVSLLAGAFGQLGDLGESLLKRSAQVKDSSHIIPGHGGILDRIDSLLFALPVLYIYLSLLYSA